MPIWTDTTTRAALPTPLGNQANTRAALREFIADTDLKAAFLTISNTFTAPNTFASDVTVGAGADLVMAKPAARVRSGSTSWAVRNNANTLDNLAVSNSGITTVRAGLLVNGGGVSVDAGGLNVAAGGLVVEDGGVMTTFEDLTTGAAPANPPAGSVRLYADTGGLIWKRTSTGIVSGVGGGGDETVSFSFGRCF